MNNATLITGDCISAMSSLGSSSIDLVLVDPPYGVTADPRDQVLKLGAMWKQVLRVAKERAAILIFCSQPFTTTLISSNIGIFKYTYIWVKNRKTGFLNAKRQPLRQVEEIAVFYRKQATYNPQKTHGHKAVNAYYTQKGGSTLGATKSMSGGGQTDRYPTNVLQFDVVPNDNSKKNKYHPNQKPVDLLKKLIQTHTEIGDSVLDFTMGSGSTGVACKELGRAFVGIELDPKYVEIAKSRIFDGVGK